MRERGEGEREGGGSAREGGGGSREGVMETGVPMRYSFVAASILIST